MYGSSELTWHCQTLSLQPIARSHLKYWSMIDRLPPKVFNCGNPRLKCGSRQKFKLWANIAADYSGRLLTCPEDKFPAIAGIVKELSKAWEDTCLYGIWQSYLVYYLVWRRDSRVERNLSRSDRAPSWSWLSMDCRIVFWPHLKRADATVLNYVSAQPIQISGSSQQAAIGLVLRAKILSGLDLPKEQTKNWMISMDLSNELQVENSIQYLLLGTSSTKQPLCLVLIALHSGLFRRVGFEQYCYTHKWSSCSPKVVTIV